MSAQDRETLAAAQARATYENTTAPAATQQENGVAGSIAEAAVVHPPTTNHHNMEVDDLERELSGAF